MAVTRMPQSTTKFVILPNSLLGLMLRIYKSPPRLSLRASRSPLAVRKTCGRSVTALRIL